MREEKVCTTKTSKQQIFDECLRLKKRLQQSFLEALTIQETGLPFWVMFPLILS